MTTTSISLSGILSSTGQRFRASADEGAIRTLQVFAITIMVIPSDVVIEAVGAAGYVASLVGIFALLAWIASTLLGFHDPSTQRSPIRAALACLWGVTLVSYTIMHLHQRPPVEELAADRFLMLLASITGVIVVAGDTLRTTEDIRRVERALVLGGAFCGLTAALQFWFSFDITWILRELPGFTANGGGDVIQSRAALNRVAGTALHPIELGTVSAMILPLAIHLLFFDTERKASRRWLQVVLILVAVPASVSRSAILALGLSIVMFVLLLPPLRRLVALAIVPVAVAAGFATIPGLVTTLTSFFSAGTSDPSIASRVDDYPFVERSVSLHPWFGQGGGSFIAPDFISILDNQYLKTAVELGLTGLIVLIIYLLVPAVAALTLRQRTQDEDLRILLGALAGASFAAAVSSFTFDAFSFPMFIGVHSLVLGLIAACWSVTRAEALPWDDPLRSGHRSRRTMSRGE